MECTDGEDIIISTVEVGRVEEVDFQFDVVCHVKILSHFHILTNTQEEIILVSNSTIEKRI